MGSQTRFSTFKNHFFIIKFKYYKTKIVSLAQVKMHKLLYQEIESGPEIWLIETFPLKINIQCTIFHEKISFMQEIYSKMNAEIVLQHAITV